MPGRPQYCLVKNCSRLKSDANSITFHKFPSNPQHRERWISFVSECNLLNPKKWQLKLSSRLCSRHFQKCCFSSYGKFRTIKNGHFPSIILDFKGRFIQTEGSHVIENTTVELNDLNENSSTTFNNSIEETHFQDFIEENKILKNRLEKKTLMLKVALRTVGNLKAKLKRVKIRSKKINSTVMNPAIVAKLGTKKCSTQTDPSYFCEIHDECESLINAICQRRKSSRLVGYGVILRDFSMKLHFYSAKAYNFLREELCWALPHPRSFQLWTENIDTSPGFLSACLQYVRKENFESKHHLYYGLCLDEVNIRKQIIFDGKEMKGYVNYGEIYAKFTKNKEAANALFVMASTVNGRTEIPIAYILTHGIDSDIISTVIKKSIEKMHEYGGNVLAVSLDGLRSNFSSAKTLGADFNVESPMFKTTILHPLSGENVYFFPDPSHMIKLLRNALESYECLIDKDGEEVKWEYFVKLVELQKKEGLGAANKLTIRHSNFAKQKMKVKLAVQLLSSSVATALSVCEKIGLADFSGCHGTANFAKLFDRVFDALNSHPGGKGYKAPLANWNKHIWRKLFFDAKEYLMGLKRKSDNKLLLHTKRSTCVTGLIVCMTSLELLMDSIVLPNQSSLKYFPTYKISQDHLELFFSSLRQRFGNNNNPNAIQLEHALRRMLAVNINPSITGNCLPQDDTFTPRISPLRKFVCNDAQEEVPHFPSFSSMSCFVDNVVVYISGFVGRKVLTEIDCETCVSSLYASNSSNIQITSDYVLLSEKNNGGLFVPSDDLINTCKRAEQVIRTIHQIGIKGLKNSILIASTLQHLLQMNVFEKIRRIDQDDHKIFGDHVLNLLKKIVSTYVKVRLHHIAKGAILALSPECYRNSLTKTVLFRGQ